MNAPQSLPSIPLRIALLGYRSHPHVGGQGIYLKYLSRALRALGHHVDVYSGPPYPELDEGIRLVKVPSLDLYAVDAPFRALRPKHLLSFTDLYEWGSKITGGFAEPYVFGRRLTNYLDPTAYDIIHDNQSLCYGLLVLARRGGCKLVATIHHPIHRDREIAIAGEDEWLFKQLKKRWYRFLTMQEKVVSKINNIVTVSQASRSDISECFNLPESQIYVAGNGVDTELFKPLLESVPDPFQLITTTSSDHPLKGLRFLIEAVAEIRQVLPQVKLQIVGELSESSPCRKLIKSLGLEEIVEFSPRLTDAELVAAYGRAKVAVCPSLYEGFGLPVIEAMACGVPVVSSRAGGLSEVVADAGVLCEPGDSRAIAEGVLKLLTDQSFHNVMRERGLEHVERHHSWQRVGERLTRYYQQLISSQHGERIPDHNFSQCKPSTSTESR